MAMLYSIFILICSLIPLQTSGDELPEWTRAHDDTNFFVVQTEEFSTHLDATNSLLPTVKKGVTDWAQRKFGSDCDQVIDRIPLKNFQFLVYENQEIVHKFRRDYDAETAERLETEYDDYYRGYVRVNVKDNFHEQIKQQLGMLRLRTRLGTSWIGAILVLGLLGILWAYLFINRVSRGFYVSRIRWITGSLIALLLLLCYGVSRLIF